MTVTLNNLRCKFGGFKSQFRADKLFNFRINIRVSADSSAEFADAYNFFCMFDAFNIALNFRAPQGKLKTESHRLGVYAVRATNARRVLKFNCAAA